MNRLSKVFDGAVRYVFEPGLNWVIDHPWISVAAVILLVYWSVRGYRMI
ncbi:MAG TPA: hypothetical protein VIB79_28185 [Candidatus Binatia bacterium]|jgi:hypothetical protein